MTDNKGIVLFKSIQVKEVETLLPDGLWIRVIGQRWVKKVYFLS